FSSRRRHTRSKRDWSSDVCSSDLIESEVSGRPEEQPSEHPETTEVVAESEGAIEESLTTEEMVFDKDKEKLVKKVKKTKKPEEISPETPIESEVSGRLEEQPSEHPETTEVVPESEEAIEESLTTEEMVFNKDKEKLVKKVKKTKKPEEISPETPIESEVSGRLEEQPSEHPETTE